MSKKRKSLNQEIIGGFGSLYDISNLKIKDPVIVSCTDGVGTKIELANKFKKYDTIGIDLVRNVCKRFNCSRCKTSIFFRLYRCWKIKSKKNKKNY